MPDEFDIEAARRNLRETTEKIKRNRLDLYGAATRDFQKVCQIIISKYSPLRIWQWESLLDRDSFREYSDIDIGIEGIIDAQTFFSLLGDAMAQTESWQNHLLKYSRSLVPTSIRSMLSSWS